LYPKFVNFGVNYVVAFELTLSTHSRSFSPAGFERLKAIICLNGHGKGEDDEAKEENQSMTYDKRLIRTFKLGKKQ
jgi:hypothetical protein